MRQIKPKNFVNEAVEVDEPEKNAVFRKGEKRSDYAAMWSETGSLILAGLPGSGRRKLATMAAEKLGKSVVAPANDNEMESVLRKTGAIVVADVSHFSDERILKAIRSGGRVFYLMVDAQTLARRVAERETVNDFDELWRSLAEQLAVAEPLFMQALHFILQAGASEDALLEELLEKASL